MLRVFFFKLFIRITSWFPLPVVHGFGVLLGKVLSSYANELSLIANKNIQMCCPDLSVLERKKLVQQSLIETAKSVMECGALWRWPIERMVRLVKEVSGWQQLEEAMAEGKGVIFIIPHVGSWEAIGLYASTRFPMTSLYRAQRNPGIDKVIARARERGGLKMAPTSAGGIRTLYKALAQGELVMILPDQEPGQDAGILAPFFGVPANTMTLLNRLARKSGAKVMVGYGERLSKGRGYHLHVEPGPDCLADDDPLVAATCLNAVVEGCVQRLPAQYQWVYRRFKTRPVGEAKVYSREDLKESFYD